MQEHTCHAGPLCQPWHESDEPECRHGSCLEIVHEDCRACFTLLMDAAEADRQRWETFTPFLNRNLCPIDLMPIGYPAVLGAPGYGIAYHCRCNHTWYRTGTLWDSSPSLLTLGDVM